MQLVRSRFAGFLRLIHFTVSKSADARDGQGQPADRPRARPQLPTRAEAYHRSVCSWVGGCLFVYLRSGCRLTHYSRSSSMQRLPRLRTVAGHLRPLDDTSCAAGPAAADAPLQRPGPLGGFRVLDMSAVISGPWGASILADQGVSPGPTYSPSDVSESCFCSTASSRATTFQGRR